MSLFSKTLELINCTVVVSGLAWYMYNRKNTLNFFWKPHLIIHLDAPSSYVVKNLKEKNVSEDNKLKENFLFSSESMFKIDQSYGSVLRVDFVLQPGIYL